MKKRLLILLYLILSVTPILALEIPELKGRINDYAEILTPQQQAELDGMLAGIEQQSGAQLVLLTQPSLDDEILEDYTVRVAQAWKLGQKEQDNGLLLFIALREKKIRIEVGYGLEELLPDGKCGTIIRQVIVPAFRNSDYHAGIMEAFRVIGTVVAGDSTAMARLEQADRREEGLPGFAIIFFVIIFIIIILVNTRRGRYLGGTGRYSGLGGGWSSGGWSGGGSGFSGGGGSFGGGGASGGW